MKRRHTLLGSFLVLFLVLVEFVWFGAILGGCGTDVSPSPEANLGKIVDDLDGPVPCSVSNTRYPTVPSDMLQVYNGRSFYADGNHLGHDVDMPEGTAIHPVACGVLRIYRPATGYGRLAVVIEHKLDTPLVVANGLGSQITISSFLSIYGHLRSSQDAMGTVGVLGHQVGDMVGPEDVIGYVDNGSTNGDGDEHLHFGVRLQSIQAAKATDTSWFRGYDTVPSHRQWFADPVLFLATLTSSVKPVFWHPPGTIIRRPSNDTLWVIDTDMRRGFVDPTTVVIEGLKARSIDVSDAELSCLEIGADYLSPRAGHKVMKFDDASTVYEYTGLEPGSWRKAFISYEAFLSWGWSDAQIIVWSSLMRDLFLDETEDHGFQVFRDGSLVKANGESEVSVVSEGRRLPIADWSTFLALGYKAEQIVSVPPDTIDLVAGPRGPLVTSDLIAYCTHPSACLDNCPPPSQGGGSGGGDDLSSSASSSGSSTSSSASSSSSSASSSSSSSSSSGGGAGGGSLVPLGKVLLHYEGPIVPGSHELQGMWDPPGPLFYDWVPTTFALCPDLVAGDGELDCLLDMPSGTTNFLFTIHLPDGRWWGDMSCFPTGGCGQSIGTVTLTGPNGELAYQYQNNGQGPNYWNGWVPLVP